MGEGRVGIIGIGNMGSAHAACIGDGKIRGMKLTCVCDCRIPRLQMVQERYPSVAVFTDYKDMYASGLVDAVVIAVPHRLHAQMAVDALESGLHVLVEKPVDVSVSQARRLNEAAEKSDRVFGIMFNQRTNQLFQKARELVQSGQLGELKQCVWIVTNWYRTQHYYDSGSWRATWAGEGGGVLLNQAPHNLDLWQWICGMPVSVTAFCDVAKYHRIEVEDDVPIAARYANGATGLFITSTGEYPGTNRLEVAGSRGKLVLENGVLKWWTLAESEREYCFSAENNSGKIETEYQEFTQTQKEAAHAGILQNFTNAILFGEKLIAPGEEGIYELMISNAAYLSQWNGNRAVNLPFEEAQFDELLAKLAETSAVIDRDCEEKSSCERGYRERWQVQW